MKSFDLIVIGTGTAASVAASRCRSAGLSVAVIDERPFGGTCALRGCDPKKVLRRAAEVVDAARCLGDKGLGDAEPRIDWPALMRHKRTFTEPVPAARRRAFEDQGIATFAGTARFLDRRHVAVGEERLAGGRFVIASGMTPRPLRIPGAEHLTTSDQFLDLDALPARLLFLGGGYVSFELAHIAARADRQVIVLDRGERPLKAFDADLVDLLVERTRDVGIDFRARAAVRAVAPSPQGLVVSTSVEGTEAAFTVDAVVHGAGRVPATAALELDKAGICAGEGGVEVNEFLQSRSNPGVYAAGDAAATGGPPLTPVASLEGHVVATNLIEGNHATPDYTGVPSAVFTIPELVRIGLTEAAAEQQGRRFTCKRSDMRDWYSVRRVGETHAAAKVLVEEGSGHILGAHMLAPEASELANLLGLAMRRGLTASEVKDLVSAYPSAGSDLGYLL